MTSQIDFEQKYSELLAKFEKQVELTEEVMHERDTDILTGLASRRTINPTLRNLFDEDKSFALTFFDLVNFKGVNEGNGHLEADNLLKAIGSYLKNFDKNYLEITRGKVRREPELDSFSSHSRYGGDELIGIYSNTQLEFLLNSFKEFHRQEFIKSCGNSVGFLSSFGVAYSSEVTPILELHSKPTLIDKLSFLEEAHSKSENLASNLTIDESYVVDRGNGTTKTYPPAYYTKRNNDDAEANSNYENFLRIAEMKWANIFSDFDSLNIRSDVLYHCIGALKSYGGVERIQESEVLGDILTSTILRLGDSRIKKKEGDAVFYNGRDIFTFDARKNEFIKIENTKIII